MPLLAGSEARVDQLPLVNAGFLFFQPEGKR